MYAEMCYDTDAVNLQFALLCVSDWAKKWQLTISIKKCCILHIGKVNGDSAPELSIDGVALPVCNSVNELGVTVNDPLAPCDHIAKISNIPYVYISQCVLFDLVMCYKIMFSVYS